MITRIKLTSRKMYWMGERDSHQEKYAIPDDITIVWVNII